MRPCAKFLHRTLPLLILLAAAPAGAIPCPAAFDETFEQTYPIAANGSLTLTNVNGSVRIEGWDKNYVEVRAIKRAAKERADLKRVRIEVETLPMAVNIRTRYPENDPAGVDVEYRVRVPYQVSLSRVETVNGNLFVSGVEGASDLRTVNGDVDVYEGGGRYSGKTTNGNVRVEMRSLARAGEMTLESVNGSVGLALPQNANAQVDARSLNGEFHTELPLMVQSGGLGREVRGSLGRGGLTLRLRSVNGRIDLVALRDTV